MSDKNLNDEMPATRVVTMPVDANAAGDIFGGWIMSQVDIAGSVAAIRRASGRVVTVAVNSFESLGVIFPAACSVSKALR